MAVIVPIVSTFDAKGVDKAVRDIEKAEGSWAKAGAGFKALEGPALDASTKALATEALILEQTNKYAGDFADTSDSMANKQRTLSAKTEDLAASFGTALLPVMEDFLGLLESGLDWISRNQDAVTKIITALAGLVAVVLAVNAAMRVYEALMTLSKVATLAYKGVVTAVSAAAKIWTGVQWLLNAALTANPIGLVVAAIALLIAAFVVAYKKSDAFRAIIDKTFTFLKTVVVGYINIYLTVFRKIWEWMQKVIDKATELGRKIRDAFKISAPSWLGGIFGSSSAAAYAAPAVGVMSRSTAPRAAATAGPITINVNGTGNPYQTAQEVKRALETYDRGQGRTPWTPLAVAW
jgi:hypothetical protein